MLAFFCLRARMSLQQVLIYRLASIMIVIFGVLFIFAEYLAINVYYTFGDTIGDWNKNEFFILFGSFNCMLYFYAFFFEIGHDEFAFKVKYGELDYDLIRPMDSMLLCSFSRLDYPSLLNLALPIFFIYSGVMGEQIEFGFFLGVGFILAILLGAFIIYLLNHLLATLFFWLTDFSNAFQVMGSMINLGSKPLKLYPWMLQVLFGFCIPIILAGNLPAELILGRVVLFNFFALISGTCILFMLTRRFWFLGLRKYSSASS